MFLTSLGIDNHVIKEIREHNEDAAFTDLCLNSENVTEVINYLREVGIVPIEELLIYKIDLFFEDVSKLKEMFEKKKYIINEINDDFFVIDYLYN